MISETIARLHGEDLTWENGRGPEAECNMCNEKE